MSIAAATLAHDDHKDWNIATTRGEKSKKGAELTVVQSTLSTLSEDHASMTLAGSSCKTSSVSTPGKEMSHHNGHAENDLNKQSLKQAKRTKAMKKALNELGATASSTESLILQGKRKRTPAGPSKQEMWQQEVGELSDKGYAWCRFAEGKPGAAIHGEECYTIDAEYFEENFKGSARRKLMERDRVVST